MRPSRQGRWADLRGRAGEVCTSALKIPFLYRHTRVHRCTHVFAGTGSTCQPGTDAQSTRLDIGTCRGQRRRQTEAKYIVAKHHGGVLPFVSNLHALIHYVGSTIVGTGVEEACGFRISIGSDICWWKDLSSAELERLSKGVKLGLWAAEW
ncbi:hypothetical protein DFH07DRAFT_317217 [Mycena maculata]|uniref:Uncharacterized protein n=1 Tax=Mycena maculata TaxID=230809 RepID=A0AAD7MIA8_9AGAR|nr:hypothetical protein DFH07DRAFT_317217 [Mycena maculata]